MCASLAQWSAHSRFPRANVRCALGHAGLIDVETAALAHTHQLPPDDFPAAVIECLPQVSADRPWQVRNGNF